MSDIPARRPRLFRAVAVPVLLGLVLTAGSPGWIRVRRGDTLWELARKYGTTVEALRELNGVGGNNLIFVGQRLRIGSVRTVSPELRRAASARPLGPATRVVDVVHVVRQGDSLYKLAARYRTDWRWIARRNNLPRSLVVRLGARLVVAQRRVAVASATPTAAHPERISKAQARQLVVAEARRAGIDPHLVVALALQESGLQQHVRSSVGAVGIMQVMPGTGAWVAEHLVRRRLNLYDAEDNVLAGVRYLGLLLKVAKNREQALAGYYQGLASVRKRGMYNDTKAYVANILALRRRLVRQGG